MKLKLILIVFTFLAFPATEIVAQDRILKTDDNLRALQIKELRFGMFVCWSFSTFYGNEWTPTLDKDASFFRATGCDTDQWCRIFQKATGTGPGQWMVKGGGPVQEWIRRQKRPS